MDHPSAPLEPGSYSVGTGTYWSADAVHTTPSLRASSGESTRIIGPSGRKLPKDEDSVVHPTMNGNHGCPRVDGAIS